MKWFATSLILIIACGGSTEEEETAQETTSGHEEHQQAQQDDGVAIEGLMGTISTNAVERGIEPRMGRFLRCFSERYHAVEVLGGHIEMGFRIKTDGTVRWVYPRASTIGDRATERCLLEQAAGIRFSRPHGGEAEFFYPLELDPPEDVRPPLNWDSTRVEEAVGDLSSCGRGPYSVTVYIAPGGTVMAVGASSEEQGRADDLDCVANEVSQWEMPDPGSYPAKVTFAI